jgi:hypothetical protein
MKNTDYSFLLAPQYIGLFILMAVGAIACAVAISRFGNALTRKATGWRSLTQKFPASDVHKFGGSYKKRNGIFGGGNQVNKSFLIELAQEGLLITADFDRTPILIPWSAISAIDEMDFIGFTMMVNLTICYERRLVFDVPKDALRAIQENVSTERFHERSIFELVKKKMLNET